MRIPLPYSGGLILSYQCNLSCIHCLYNCRGNWKGWIENEKIVDILKRLKKISNFVSLHLTGGEPFINLPLLIEAVKICRNFEIPFFIETNCYWAKNKEIAENILIRLKESGLNSIMLSYSIFYVYKVPIRNFENAMEVSFKIFGRENVSFYTFNAYRIVKESGISESFDFEKSIEIIGKEKFLNFLGNYLVPKGKCLYTLEKWFYKYSPERFKGANCIAEFLNPHHIHIDLYGNYIPSFCSGITLGNYKRVLENGIIMNDRVLNFLINDIYQLLLWAEGLGYKRKDAYINKCHLCLDIRKFLVDNGFKFDCLKPEEFYHEL
ncbi:MAG: radical SAM protein [Candidatus Omnitrophica bacterium]|nr:radical SAM protein [Candidatus Omnitrophota bacterium]MCM8803294.1 radical SAM protein [Candidatus Omnitrophota bacterium]